MSRSVLLIFRNALWPSESFYSISVCSNAFRMLHNAKSRLSTASITPVRIVESVFFCRAGNFISIHIHALSFWISFCTVPWFDSSIFLSAGNKVIPMLFLLHSVYYSWPVWNIDSHIIVLSCLGDCSYLHTKFLKSLLKSICDNVLWDLACGISLSYSITTLTLVSL